MHKKTIVFTSNAYFPSIGGIENSLRHLAMESVKHGYDPILVVGDIGMESPARKVTEEMVDGIRVLRFPFRRFSAPVLQSFNLFFAYYCCWKILKSICTEYPSAYVVARFHFNAILAVLAGFKCVRYLVPSVMKNQMLAERGYPNKWAYASGKLSVFVHGIVQKLALKHCKNYVFSETMRKQCMELAGNKLIDYKIVKPGVDGQRFFPLGGDERLRLRKKHGLPSDKIILLFVGRFVKAKGVGLIISAMHHVKSCDIHLVLVGEGKQKSEYAAQVSRSGLSGQVSIFESTREVEEFYQLADLFVMSSSYEPLGQTILEAFSSGLKVIAFKQSEEVDTATEELEMDHYVNYVTYYDFKSLANEFMKLEEFNFSSGKKIHLEVLEKYSWASLLRCLMSE